MCSIDTPVGQCVLDRLILDVLDAASSDLLGGPIHSVVARIAAEKVREGIRLRRGRGQSVDGELATIARMSQARLRALCEQRVKRCAS